MAQERIAAKPLSSGAAGQLSPLILPPLQHNLPASLTPLTGRQAELEQIERHLRDPACRLLTLTGPGGIGKTRLALEVGWRILRDLELAARFADGCFVVSLAEVNEADQLPSVMAATLPIDFDPARELLGQMIAALRTSRRLLILDNLEQLTAASGLLLRLLEGAPELVILATSQERLNLTGEWIMEVAGLAVPVSATDEGRNLV